MCETHELVERGGIGLKGGADQITSLALQISIAVAAN